MSGNAGFELSLLAAHRFLRRGAVIPWYQYSPLRLKYPYDLLLAC
jgi:hypothetical protein